MDNRIEDQKRMERIENEVLRLRAMILTLLSPAQRDNFRLEIQRENEIAAQKRSQS